MGGRGGSSGLSGGSSDFKTISLAGKTGTEKQKAYAESLLETARLTAKTNGVAGYSNDGNMRKYTSQEDADAVKGAYKFLEFSVGSRKTYGEVIDLMKSQNVLSLAKNIKTQAARSGKSINKFVDDMIEAAKKKKKR